MTPGKPRSQHAVITREVSGQGVRDTRRKGPLSAIQVKADKASLDYHKIFSLKNQGNA